MPADYTEDRKEILKNTRRCIRDAGGVPAVAKHFGLRDWAVRKWFNSGHVPISRVGNRVTPLVALANEKVDAKRPSLPGFDMCEPRVWTEADLRPDVFGSH